MFRRRATWVLGVTGLVLVVVGVERVVATASGAGLVTVVVVGALLLVSPFIIARVERLSVSTSGFELRLTRDMAALGAPKAAQIVDRTNLARFAESYDFIHKELEDKKYYDAKIHLQDRLVEEAAALARKEKFDASEVRTLFANASPTMRVLAIGLMKGEPALADGPTILAAIADPQSANEQYQALELARLRWPQLSKSYRAAIQSMVADNTAIKAGVSRRQLADEILALPVS
jgi:hypothetical protein